MINSFPRVSSKEVSTCYSPTVDMFDKVDLWLLILLLSIHLQAPMSLKRSILSHLFFIVFNRISNLERKRSDFSRRVSMYLIMIKWSFAPFDHFFFFIHITTVHSLFNSHYYYRCCCLDFARLYDYYFLQALSPSLFLLLFFFIIVVVVLATTTTRFSFFSSFPIAFSPSSVYMSVVFYQQIHCSTHWLFQCWTNISRHCTERENEKKTTAARALSDTKARSFWCSLSLWLFYYMHRVYFPFLVLSSSLFRTGHQQAFLIQWPTSYEYERSLQKKGVDENNDQKHNTQNEYTRYKRNTIIGESQESKSIFTTVIPFIMVVWLKPSNSLTCSSFVLVDVASPFLSLSFPLCLPRSCLVHSHHPSFFRRASAKERERDEENDNSTQEKTQWYASWNRDIDNTCFFPIPTSKKRTTWIRTICFLIYVEQRCPKGNNERTAMARQVLFPI